MFVSLYAKKVFDKNQYLFMIKVLERLYIKVIYGKIIICNKIIVNFKLSRGKLKVIPLKKETR